MSLFANEVHCKTILFRAHWHCNRLVQNGVEERAPTHTAPRSSLQQMSSTTLRERRNWLIHLYFTRSEFAAALALIEETLRACGGLCEYALFLKSSVRRLQGSVGEALQLAQAALCLNPCAPANLKHVGRALFLAGRHRGALEAYAAAARADSEDWETSHAAGACHARLGEHAAAVACFETANSIARHPATFLALARAQAAGGDASAAIGTLSEALEYTPEHAEVLALLGLLHHRQGDGLRAFEHLGASLTHAPREPAAVLAAAALMQTAGDYDVALVKYRVAAVHTPTSAQMWSNIGMCFAGKGKHVAAVACLKRAQYLDPFQWGTAYNLGLVHLRAECYASAFLYLNAAANMNPRHGETLLYLAVTLARLQDEGNARAAYAKAAALCAGDRGLGAPALARLYVNYAVSLYNWGDVEGARAQFVKAQGIPAVRAAAAAAAAAAAPRWAGCRSPPRPPFTPPPTHTHTPLYLSTSLPPARLLSRTQKSLAGEAELLEMRSALAEALAA